MRSLALIIIFNCASFSCSSQNIDNLRTYFLLSFKNEVYCDSLNLSIDKNINENLLNGYKGIYYIMKCNYIINPYKKILYFRKGKEILEKSIQKDPQCIELRILRYSVQNKVPIFLSYNHKTDEDISFINENKNNLKEVSLQHYIEKILEGIK